MKSLFSFLSILLLALVSVFFTELLFWISRFKKASKDRIPALVYHKIGDRFEWGITRQRVRQFEQQMRYLKEQGYQSISIDQALDPENFQDRKRVVITFDDSYESAYSHVFPILQDHGFTASIFVITGYVGKYNEWDVNWGRKFKHLSWDQIKEMKEYGFSFGSHTVNHPDLTKLEKRFIEYELKRSKQMLEDRLSQEVDCLSFPFGKYNQEVEELARDIGYCKAFTICSKPQNSNSGSLVHGRLGMYLFDSPLTLKIKLERGKLFWVEDLKGRIINSFASGTTLVKKPDYSRIEPQSVTLSSQKPI